MKKQKLLCLLISCICLTLTGCVDDFSEGFKAGFESGLNGSPESISTNAETENIPLENTEIINDLTNYDLELTLKELYNEFSSNNVRGNKKYMNKRIKITAPIKKIETEYNGVLSIMLDASKNDGKAKDNWAKVTLKENNLNCYAVFDFKEGNDNGIIDYDVGDKITIIGNLQYANGNTLGFYESKIIN